MGCFSKWQPGGCGCGAAGCGGSPCTLPPTNLHWTIADNNGSSGGLLTYALVGGVCTWTSACVLPFNIRYQMQMYSTPTCFALILQETHALAANCSVIATTHRSEDPALCYDGVASDMTLLGGWTCSPLNFSYQYSSGGITRTVTITP